MKLEDRITAALINNTPMSISEIYLVLGRDCKLTTLSQRLAWMCREGVLTRVGTGIYDLTSKSASKK